VLPPLNELGTVDAEFGDRLPPESLRKCTQQYLHHHVLDHHAALGDYSAGMIVQTKT
jgi:hypothetical protein